jgi:hypothetical protein
MGRPGKLFRVLIFGLATGLARPGAAAQAPGPGPAAITMPPVADLRVASRAYPVTTLARTNHAGWTESVGCANVPQEVRIAWHVDGGGEALLHGRAAWDPAAPWREIGRWGRGVPAPREGETAVTVETPTLLRLRVRAAKFPRSGIASLRAAYRRHTIAALRGASGTARRPVILAEGYDPFNAQDWNETGWQDDPTFARLISRGRQRHNLDLWMLDWGDGGAPLEQQAQDFAEIARQVRAWNGGRTGTVAVGISMGAVSLRYALAAAADGGEDLGVRKYVSLNGPHQGAWVNPDLLRFLLKRAAENRSADLAETSEPFLIRRGLDSPAARELLIGGAGHKAFYADLRSHGVGGYHPGIPRVGFSNGTLIREGNELADFSQGKPDVAHRVSVRPLWLPLWITLHRTPREFRYGAYPGELLAASLRRPVREHVKLFGLFRFDFRARWEAIPTFIPTHSALDFPEDLTGSARRYRYSEWRKSAFTQFYVARGRNLAHDETSVDWIDPRTGKGAPQGQNAVLYEIAQATATP